MNPLHRVWRALPVQGRRAALRVGVRILAPRGDPLPPPPQRGVGVAGELDRASGLGEGSRLILRGLEALAVDSWPLGMGAAVPPQGVPLILHGNPAAVPYEMLRLGRRIVRGRRIIGVWPWELPEVPPAWREGFGYVHEVWAPSRFSAAAVERAMPAGFRCRKVRVVPYPVACQALRPATQGRAALGLPEDAVITLVVFNLASSFVRKNPLGAVAAHRVAFGTRMDRVLWIRVGNPDHAPADFAQLMQAVAELPNVRVETALRSREDAHAVMAASDIVLSMHRSEGFGLVPAEAMLLGKPVVATAWSGTEDFLRDEWAARVAVRLVPAVDPRGVFEAAGAVWAEPEIGDAAAHLVRLADDAALRQQMGAAGRAAAPGLLGARGLGEAVEGLGLPLGIAA